MDDKTKIYEEILKKYKLEKYGDFISTDDIGFDFKAEATFIIRDAYGYNLFIEETNTIYLFCLRFDDINTHGKSTRFVKIKDRNIVTTVYSSQTRNAEFSERIEKFDFMKENFSRIIKKIRKAIFIITKSKRKAINLNKY